MPENGPNLAAVTVALLCAAFSARAGAEPKPFALALTSEAGGRILYLDAISKPDPAGWAALGFDDSAWGEPQVFGNGWMPEALRLPWRSYAVSGKSRGSDRLLLRLPLDLPRGLALDKAELQLVADDNAQIWVNGRRAYADADDLFVPDQPRSFDLRAWFKPCANVLALRVSSPRPTGIGYKFRLILAGRQDLAQPCEPPSPTPTLRPTSTRAPTPSPLPSPTLRPSPPPPPTLRPTPRPTARPALRPTFRATPRPTRRPTPRPSARPTPRATSRPPKAGPTATARPTRTAPPTPSPCPTRARASASPRVLAEARDFRLGDGGADALPASLRASRRDQGAQIDLTFTLAAPARVWAEAAGVEGLRVLESDPAPEAFLDEQYLGPLLAAHGGDWRSPRALRLPAGPHRLTLRLARQQDAADVALRRLAALSDPLPPTPGPCD